MTVLLKTSTNISEIEFSLKSFNARNGEITRGKNFADLYTGSTLYVCIFLNDSRNDFMILHDLL